MDGHIDWPRLRSFNGSQDAAFEELCKQIFGSKTKAAGGEWIPKGKIDGGVEGYAVMPDASEWGIQAKWFLISPTPRQWNEVDDSVKQALDRHPKLQCYSICMPLDLSDSRTPGTKSARDVWNERKAKYDSWATERKMPVAFEFFGSSQLVSELMNSSMRGRAAYWFGGPGLSRQWLESHIKDAIAFAGPRYSPLLNVELPLVKNIDALSLNSKFVARVFDLYRELRARDSVLAKPSVVEVDGPSAKQIGALVEEILSTLQPLASTNFARIDWAFVRKGTSSAADLCAELSRKLWSAGESVHKEGNERSVYDRNKFEHETSEAWQLGSTLRKLANFCSSEEVELSARPFLLLVGPGGVGKTHFFCDSAARIVDSGNLAIVLFGERFTGQEVWRSIADHVGLPADHDVTLGALNAAAEASGERALIFIDAINEGVGADFWYSRLNVLAGQVSRYPYLALVVSVRDTFEESCISEAVDDAFIRIEHQGFAYDIVDAQRSFFRNFNIVEPSAPLLLPEFANPLFLKLLCEGIVDQGITEFPRGLSGISAVFGFYVQAQNKKISKTIDVDPSEHVVQRAITLFAEKLVEANQSELDKVVAKQVADAVGPANRGWEKSLFNQLCREGVLTLVPVGDKTLVRFSYERFSDHARATQMLSALDGDFDQLSDSKSKIAMFITAARNFTNRAQGVVEAFMIQVPEMTGRELSDYLGNAYNKWELQRFLSTMPWRTPKSVPKATCDFILGLLDDEELRSAVVDCILSCALIEGHGLNADALDAFLAPLEMARRDELWTIPISEVHYEPSAVDRLTKWAREGAFGAAGESAAAYEARLSAITALLWLCTSSNRSVRDNATKAIVTILDRDVTLLLPLWKRFHHCNDPYVVQRLYAVLAGSVMRRSEKSAALENLVAAVIYHAKAKQIPIDLLARDFARSIVEKSGSLGVSVSPDDAKTVCPPYDSLPPDFKDSDTELFEKYSWTNTEHFTEEEREARRGLLAIHSSLDKHGDFSRYIVGTNSSRGDWIDVPLSEPLPSTDSDLLERLKDGLNSEQAAALAEYDRSSWSVIYEVVGDLNDTDPEPDGALVPEVTPATPNEDAQEQRIAATRQNFEALLSPDQLELFHLSESAPNDLPRVSLFAGNRWMFRRVLEMGYAGKQFNEFDSRAIANAWSSGSGRQPATIERIGKKYQWIAYFEFLARMADNYHLSSWVTNGHASYEVPSQVHSHDIDPSNLLTKTMRPLFEPHAQTWWAGDAYTNWRLDLDIAGWTQDVDGLPDPKSAIEVTDADGAAWVTLGVHLDWREPESILDEKYKVPKRELWYLIYGYLVPKGEAERIFESLSTTNFYGGLEPSPRDAYEILWGELFWSKGFSISPMGLEADSTHFNDSGSKGPEDLLSSAVAHYMREKARDNSIDDTLLVAFPIRELVLGLGAHGSLPEDGAWVDESGTVIAFDPSTKLSGPQSVLVRRDRLESFLKKSEFALMWAHLSEKQVIGGYYQRTGDPFVLSGAYWLQEQADGTFSLLGRTKVVDSHD